MIKGQPRALHWRIYAVVAASVWVANLFVQIGKVGVARALLSTFLAGALVGVTGLLAFGYHFKSNRVQRRVCMAGLMLCLKRLVPLLGAATVFFHSNVARAHLSASGASVYRGEMVLAASIVGLELWALAALAKHPADDEDSDDEAPSQRRRRLIA